MNKLLLTPKEATELLGISRSKLYELLRAGTIESVKIGDCRRVSEPPWTSTSSAYGAKQLLSRHRRDHGVSSIDDRPMAGAGMLSNGLRGGSHGAGQRAPTRYHLDSGV